VTDRFAYNEVYLSVSVFGSFIESILVISHCLSFLQLPSNHLSSLPETIETSNFRPTRSLCLHSCCRITLRRQTRVSVSLFIETLTRISNPVQIISLRSDYSCYNLFLMCGFFVRVKLLTCLLLTCLLTIC